MELRCYQSEDLSAMAALFYETVHHVNAKDYSPEALDAWADGTVDLNAWDQSFRAHVSLVAVEGKKLLGFADMAANGYLDRLYVSCSAQRQGVATALVQALEARVQVQHYVTHASITAVPFFKAMGYHVVRAQTVERKGVLLTNFIMEKAVS